MNQPSSWKIFTLALALLAALAFVAQTRAAEDENPIVGTWKLNLFKSKFVPGPPPRSQTRVYRQMPDGILVTIDTVDANGHKLATIEFPEKYDGQDHPTKGSEIADALALKRINNYQSEGTLKHAGTVVATTRRIVTDNGKTLMLIYEETNTENPKNDIYVYDRQ